MTGEVDLFEHFVTLGVLLERFVRFFSLRPTCAVNHISMTGVVMKFLKNHPKNLLAIVALSIMTVPSMVGAQTSAAAGDSHKMNMPMADSSSMQGKDLMQSMTKMRSQMDAMAMTGNVDEDFAMMMRAHHQGAIDMAKTEVASGKNAELRKIAQKVIIDQTKEIAQLDKWMSKKSTSMKK
jgi:hypothetical protein